MSTGYFLTYFSILFIATITPGPSMLLALNHGVNHGVFKTIYSGLGNLAGNILMGVVSFCGLGVILAASGVLFNIVKWTGVAYLVFIGVKMFLGAKKTAAPVNAVNASGSGRRRTGMFTEGLIIAIGNPKGILFFTALFPQFIDIKTATPVAFTIVLSTLGFVAFGCYMLYAVSGARLGRLFQIGIFRKWFNRVTGSVFIGSGLTIALTKR